MTAVVEVHTHGEKVIAEFWEHNTFGVVTLIVGGSRVKLFVDSAEAAEDVAREIAYAVTTMRRKK